MSDVVAKQSAELNNAANIKNPQLSWMIGFLFVVSFLGLFSVLPLRKVWILATTTTSRLCMARHISVHNALLFFLFSVDNGYRF